MEVSEHPQAPAPLTLRREPCYTLSTRLHGPGASPHVLNKRKIACNCQGLNMVIQSVAQSLNCNVSGSLKFLYSFLSSPMRVTGHVHRNLLVWIILRKQVSRTSYEAPHYAECSILLSVPPSYCQILFLKSVAENTQPEHARLKISAE